MTNFTRPGRLWIPEAPHLWTRGRTREFEAAVAGPQYEGWITVEKIHARTGDVTWRSTFKNLITDAGLVGLGNSFGMASINSLAVGTGNTAPAVGQTALVGELARTNFNNGQADVGVLGTGSLYWKLTRVRLFTEGQANGNIAELGMFTALNAGTMWMRQLIRDINGAATTITKTAADQLRITYEIRQYWPTVDANSVAVINGINYTFTSRPLGVTYVYGWGPGTAGNVSGVLASFGYGANGYIQAQESQVLVPNTDTGPAAGTQLAPTSYTRAAYTSPNLYVDNTAVFDPIAGNFATGIGGFTVAIANGGLVHIQLSVAPKIPKLDTQRLTLQFRQSWGRGP